jgi:hypothetical protein
MIRRITMTLAVLAVASVTFAADHMQPSPAPASPSFDKMKALVGSWKADVPGMGMASASYKLYSDGTALVEELKTHGDTMVSVYYPTADGVAMTHYCTTHNQPHMVATGGAQNLSFSEVSIDNLQSKDAMHMKAVDFAFKDENHFTATWTNASAGHDMAVPFNFVRVK